MRGPINGDGDCFSLQSTVLLNNRGPVLNDI